MPTIASESIAIPVAPGDQIEGDVSVPNLATGLVIFTHGSGSTASARVTEPWPRLFRSTDSGLFSSTC